MQALAKAPCAAIAASINFRAVTRFSRKSRAISISVPESRSPGIVISRDGPEPQTWLSLIRPAVERCVRLLQTVHWNVAAVDPVGARRSDKHDHIRHLLGGAEAAHRKTVADVVLEIPGFARR